MAVRYVLQQLLPRPDDCSQRSGRCLVVIDWPDEVKVQYVRSDFPQDVRKIPFRLRG